MQGLTGHKIYDILKQKNDYFAYEGEIHVEYSLTLDQNRKVLKAAVILADCLTVFTLAFGYLYFQAYRSTPVEGVEYLRFSFETLIESSPLFLIPQLLVWVIYFIYVHRGGGPDSPMPRVKKRLLRFGICFALFCALLLSSRYFPEYWEHCVVLACYALVFVIWVLLQIPLHYLASKKKK